MFIQATCINIFTLLYIIIIHAANLASPLLLLLLLNGLAKCA